MKLINIICLILLLLPLFASDYEEFKLGEKQQYEGHLIFDDMVRSLGDVHRIRTMRTKGITSQPVEYGNISFPVQVELKFPNKLRLKFEDKEFIIEEDRGWLKYPQGFYENLPDKYITTFNGNLNRNLIMMAKSENDYKIQLIGEKTILERECYELELDQDGEVVTLFIDKLKQLPVRMIYQVEGKKMFRTFLEYKVFDGIDYPVRTISTDVDGNMISEITINKVEFNIKIDGF